MVVQNVIEKSVAKSKMNNDGDVSCWNCFTVEGDEQEKDVKPAVTLKALRKQEREKLKLYSFIASEISRPKAVPLKQKMTTNYALAQKLDNKSTDKINSQIQVEVRKNETLQNAEIIFGTPTTEVQKNGRDKEYKMKSSNNYVHAKPEAVEQKPKYSEKNTNMQTITNKIEMETSNVQTLSEIVENHSKLHYSTIIQVKKNDKTVEYIEQRKKRNITSSSDELDRIEEAGSSGSDSGYTASSLPHGINDLMKSDENVIQPISDKNEANNIRRNTLPLSHEIPRVKSDQIFNKYLPVLNSSNCTAITSSNSLCTISPKKTPKTLRWSTMSIHQKPLFQGK